MATNAELQAEVDRLNAEADELAAERDRLAEENDRLRAGAEGTQYATHPDPNEPSFGLTEGNRAELEQRGHTISPFTGALLVGDSSTDEDGKPTVSNVREVSAEEYERVARKASEEAMQPDNRGTRFPKADAA